MIALDLLAAMKHWPDLWNFLGFLEAIGPPKSCLNSSMLGHEGVSQVHRKKKKKKVKKWIITGKAFFLKGKFIKVLELDLPAIFFP